MMSAYAEVRFFADVILPLSSPQYIPYPYACVTLNPNLAIFDTQSPNVFYLLTSDTRAMGRVSDVLWRELSVT